MSVSVLVFVFTVLTLNLDRIVNGSRLRSDQVNTHERAHRNSNTYTHARMHKITRKGSAFPEPQSSGPGTLDLVIISRAVSFDLLLMSVLGSSHL